MVTTRWLSCKMVHDVIFMPRDVIVPSKRAQQRHSMIIHGTQCQCRVYVTLIETLTLSALYPSCPLQSALSPLGLWPLSIPLRTMLQVLLAMLTNGRLMQSVGVIVMGALLVVGLYMLWRWYVRVGRKSLQNSGVLGLLTGQTTTVASAETRRLQDRVAQLEFRQAADDFHRGRYDQYDHRFHGQFDKQLPPRIERYASIPTKTMLPNCVAATATRVDTIVVEQQEIAQQPQTAATETLSPSRAAQPASTVAGAAAPTPMGDGYDGDGSPKPILLD